MQPSGPDHPQPARENLYLTWINSFKHILKIIFYKQQEVIFAHEVWQQMLELSGPFMRSRLHFPPIQDGFSVILSCWWGCNGLSTEIHPPYRSPAARLMLLFSYPILSCSSKVWLRSLHLLWCHRKVSQDIVGQRQPQKRRWPKKEPFAN